MQSQSTTGQAAWSGLSCGSCLWPTPQQRWLQLHLPELLKLTPNVQHRYISNEEKKHIEESLGLGEVNKSVSTPHFTDNQCREEMSVEENLQYLGPRSLRRPRQHYLEKADKTQIAPKHRRGNLSSVKIRAGLGDSFWSRCLQLGKLHPQPAASHIPCKCPQVCLETSQL